MKELLNCPFCGGEAGTATSPYRCGIRTVQVYCRECGAGFIGQYGLQSRPCHLVYHDRYKKTELTIPNAVQKPSPMEVYEGLKERWNRRAENGEDRV